MVDEFPGTGGDAQLVAGVTAVSARGAQRGRVYIRPAECELVVYTRSPAHRAMCGNAGVNSGNSRISPAVAPTLA